MESRKWHARRPARPPPPAPRTPRRPAPVPGAAPPPTARQRPSTPRWRRNPGATTAVIADTAGIGRPAAREALTAMEKAGTVTRVKGGKPGVPDTWTLAGAAPPAPARHRTRKTSRTASPATAPSAAWTAPARTRRPTAPARTDCRARRPGAAGRRRRRA